MSSLVLVDSEDGVATVTLNRPEKRNALSVALRRELIEVFERVGADPSVAVVVVTGAPPAFCAGMDKTEFGGDAAHRQELYDTSTGLFETLGALPHPVIAAVNGPALGGGTALAAVCDVRLASPAATFGTPEINLGIPASYASLIRMFPDQVARELAFTGRIVGAEEALDLGAVRAIDDDVVGRARALAREMAKHGAGVLSQTKRIVVAADTGAARAAYDAEMGLFRAALFAGLEP